MWLCVVGRDGKIREEKLLGLTNGSCGPQVDGDGNIYVMDNVLPKDMPVVPPEFAEALKERRDKWNYKGIFGSVIKFPPAGGGVYRTKISAKYTSLTERVTKETKEVSGLPEKPRGKLVAYRTVGSDAMVDNAEWVRPYASPATAKGCICFLARMSLDRYGRLFVPEAPSRRINVLDTEGNRICSFGRYGNADNGGKDSLRPIDGVPINWAYNVAASDKALYIADTDNRRVLRVRLDYRAAASCPLP
jgi:hypothetical protein